MTSLEHYFISCHRLSTDLTSANRSPSLVMPMVSFAWPVGLIHWRWFCFVFTSIGGLLAEILAAFEAVTLLQNVPSISHCSVQFILFNSSQRKSVKGCSLKRWVWSWLLIINSPSRQWERWEEMNRCCDAGVLPLLVLASVSLDDGVAPLILQLLQCALCGSKAADQTRSGHAAATTAGSTSSSSTTSSATSTVSPAKSKREEKTESKSSADVKKKEGNQWECGFTLWWSLLTCCDLILLKCSAGNTL